MKKSVFFVIIIAILAAAFVFTRQATAPDTNSNQLTVQASFYPIAYFAERIAGEFGSVEQLTETGTDPHNFSLSPSQRIRLQEADVFLFNGASFDPWAEQIEDELEANGVVVAEMAEKITLRETDDEEEHEDAHEEDEHEEDEHGHEGVDPHFWLDPMNAKIMVEEIAGALIEADPENAAAFLANAETLTQELTELDDAYRQGLNNCSLNSIIVSHDAFEYLSDRYEFTTLAIAGLSPDAEPSAKTFGELQTLAKQRNIQHVFFEELASSELSDTLANDIGATTLVLNPIESLSQEQLDLGEDYFTQMLKNLKNLQTALQCS